MGHYSWLYADTGRPIEIFVPAESYLLVPEPFQEKYGKYIKECRYNGYGCFDCNDIFELIAEWNRNEIPGYIELMKNGVWEQDVGAAGIEELEHYYNGESFCYDYEVRNLGILLACYDSDNFRLKYPIKITSKEMEYSEVQPSKSDPNQGR